MAQDTDDEELREVADSVFPEYSGVQEENWLWIGAEVWFRDYDHSADPQYWENELHDFVHTFLEKGGYDYGAEDPSEFALIRPAESSWEQNPLHLRYRAEAWDPRPEEYEPGQDSVMDKRVFSFSFPIVDTISQRDLMYLWERFEDQLVRAVDKTHNMEINFQGDSIQSSWESVVESEKLLKE